MQTPACANHTNKQTFLCRKRSSSGMDPHRANTDGITAKSNVCAAPSLGPPLQCSWFGVRPPEHCPPQAGAVNPPPGHPRPSTAPPSSCRCCRPVPPRSRAPALCRWSTRWLCALWDQPNRRELSSVLKHTASCVPESRVFSRTRHHRMEKPSLCQSRKAPLCPALQLYSPKCSQSFLV